MNQKLLALYGLKWNPFAPELPIEAIHIPPRIENFCWRIAHAQIREGGFAMIHGDPGTRKSVALRLLAERLARLSDVTVGASNHPQSSLVDFYRELGDIFAVPLNSGSSIGSDWSIPPACLGTRRGRISAPRRSTTTSTPWPPMSPQMLIWIRNPRTKSTAPSRSTRSSGNSVAASWPLRLPLAASNRSSQKSL